MIEVTEATEQMGCITIPIAEYKKLLEASARVNICLDVIDEEVYVSKQDIIRILGGKKNGELMGD